LWATNADRTAKSISPSRYSCNAAHKRGDLVAPIGCSHVIPPVSLGSERHPEALAVGADAQAIAELAVALG
jgi:hypothetical protein